MDVYIYIYDSKPQTPYLCMIPVCIYNIEKPCLRKPCLTKPVPIEKWKNINIKFFFLGNQTKGFFFFLNKKKWKIGRRK